MPPQHWTAQGWLLPPPSAYSHVLYHRFYPVSVQLKTTSPQHKALLHNLLHLTDLGKFEKFALQTFAVTFT